MNEDKINHVSEKINDEPKRKDTNFSEIWTGENKIPDPTYKIF